MSIQIDYTMKNASHTEFVILYDQLKKLKPFSLHRVLVLDDRPLRSPNANRYLWFVYTVISDHTGYTKTEVHSIMKYMFNMTIKFTPFFAIEDSKSTSKMKSDVFYWYTQQIRIWANNWLGVDIPDRDSLTEDQKIAVHYMTSQ